MAAELASRPGLPAAARARLVAVEAELQALGWRRGSLDPARTEARGLVAACEAALRPDDDRGLALALARGLADVTVAQARSFPENLFADCDYLVAGVARRARAAADPAAYVDETCAQMVRLQHLFGRDTAIRFRYTHDFGYGYDWAKWVAREPDGRAGVLPFDPAFLSHMEARAHQLLALIADDDAEYPGLPEGQVRNPFPFDREPAAETALHRALAARGELPLAAWDSDAAPQWDRPYAALRVAQAGRMGLLRASPEG